MRRPHLIPGVRWSLATTLLVGFAAWAGIELESSGSASLTAVVVGLAALAGIATFGLARRLAAARSLALRDSLTGLPNRTLLDDRIEQALHRAHRTGESFALLVIDLDGFKEVNDIRGHDAGDRVLVETARRLETVVRASDTVARIGGDEFVILSTETREDEQAAGLVARIRRELRRPHELDGGAVEIDGSIGWSIFPSDGVSPIALLERADSQMFATKREAEDPTARRRGTLDAGIVREFEKALERDELVVHYQPVLSIADGAVVAAEALIRRQHPTHGLVTPGEFLPHIARTPLIRTLTLHVVAEALRQAAEWRRLGSQLSLYVNIPYRLLDDPVLLEGLRELTAAPSDRVPLTLEIVPCGRGAGAELDHGIVNALRALGIRLALDDFGRSSSLAALRALPLDEVKLDATFVKGLTQRHVDAAITRSLVSLAHELDLGVTAKGVETRETWDALPLFKCERAQGYYITGPLAPDEFTSWLRTAWPQAA